LRLITLSTGGYYPSNHPILTSPNLLLNQFDHEDFWGLAELLGQVKPPVASKADIERAGLEVIKGKLLKQYAREGKVTNNTSDRVSCCLDIQGHLELMCFRGAVRNLPH
jgi:hypothetical protein